MITAARDRLITLMELLNMTLPWPLPPQQETGIGLRRECSKKSVQQGRSPFCIPLVCLVLLTMVGCSGFQNVIIVPLTSGILSYLNLNESSVLTQADTTGGVNEAGDQYGAALAVGDINGDFFGDLAVGAPGNDPVAVAGTATTGSVFVYRGSAAAGIAGLTTAAVVVINQDDLTDDIGPDSDVALLTPLEAGDQFGAALGVGDFNGDALVDVAVSAPGDGFGAEPPMSGAVSLYQNGDISFQIRP